MAQQGGEPRVGGLDPGAHVLCIYVDAKGQGVDENAQRPIRGMAALHAPHQYGAEHHLFFTGQHRQHLRPAHMEQAGGTHPQLPGLRAQPLAECCGQRQADFADATGIALHVLQAVRQGRLADVAKHLAEETFVFRLTDAQACLRHIVAKRHGLAKRRALAQQARLHFMAHHFEGAVVEGHMVEQQGGDNALIQRVVGPHQAQQRCPGHVEAIMASVEQPMQLSGNIAVGRVQLQRLHRQACLAPHHLRGLLQTVPDHAGAQNIVAVHHALQGLGEGLETLQAVERKLRLHHVGVALFGADVVEQNAFLQRRQRVNVLDIRHTAIDRGHDALDFVLAQRRQGQHRRGDVLGPRRDAIGRHLHFAGLGGRIFTGLDQFDQGRLVLTQRRQDQRVAQRLFVALYRQLLALERQLHVLGFQRGQ
ncbi:hypothetical protein ALP97_05230 [Pseudomonas salomonii]|uniref:Uncharacterized protein n=1 Tax=Pseudomonas salomonii TaxID=191391 RepID=A0A3M4QFA6_9PSED|nr:hypothetical protein ALP97_05230 [Pseudomonas salomonii]